ncbi:hypothetical protein ACN1NW_000502 [Acinetobacter baumannii]|nr:hypothetical protein [Acinetobacter baumannii]ELA7031084.1 hypothetical protein [Acinetobacter baumannii]ELA7118847.1 hypothetical protein [Acinetobacter baumannii]ELB0919797.1 hypothetical protein [Acinetobacter baumannii]ELB0965974.1 hypothetical protein [Acinetobacter baumannii]
MADLSNCISRHVAEVKRITGVKQEDIINALKSVMGDELGMFAAINHLDDAQIAAIVADLAKGVELIAQQKVSSVERIKRDYMARF